MTYTFPKIVITARAIVISKYKFLLIKRSIKDRYMPGKWEIPGGKMEIGEDLFETLEKEILEETGIVVKPISRMSYVESGFFKNEGMGNPDFVGKPYITITSLVKTDNTKIILSEEHDDSAWVTFPEAMEMDLRFSTKRTLLALETKIKDIFWR